MIKTVPTQPFKDQQPGTSGLRKKVAHFRQRNYVENFLQAIFNALPDIEGSLLVLGGDGRFYNDEVIQKAIRMAAANNVERLIVGRDGLMSTPAVSNMIRKEGAAGGIILSASHNPGGPDGDFGLKFNAANGGPATRHVTDAIHAESLKLQNYREYDAPDVDLTEIGNRRIGKMKIEIVDPVAAYADLMEQLFDFGAIARMIGNGFTLRFDAMHAITGPYAREILIGRLGANPGSVINGEPLEDFGGGHPDPNPVHARELFDYMMGPDGADFGAASDGDGDRNLILGRGILVSPSDSLAILAANATSVPAFSAGLKGIARSMPTSAAADRVGQKHSVPIFETPTGWKFFGNLLDAGRVSICGEESAGTGGDHVREKDGIWAVLFWLNILAVRGKSVKDIVTSHWREFGRNYYARWDYEGLDPEVAQELYSGLRRRLGENLSGADGVNVTESDEFAYTDPVDETVTEGQGLRFMLEGGSRVVFRLSGTGTSDATLRMYIERYEPPDGQIGLDNAAALEAIARFGVELAQIEKFTGMTSPSVIA